MGDMLWRQILKINARAVFLFAVLLLGVEWVTLVHREVRREAAGISVAGHSVHGQQAAPQPVHAAASALTGEKMEDPFTSAFLMAWFDLQASRSRDRATQSVAVKPPPRPAAPVPQQPKPAPTPKTAPTPRPATWKQVIYQGVIVQTDGTSVALVRDVDGGTLHTLTVGAIFLGSLVKEIDAKHILIVADENDQEGQSLQTGIVSRVRKVGP